MRTPHDLPTARSPRSRRRARWWLIGAVVVVIILLASLRSLASIYTDGLWFSSVHYHDVFSTLLVVKLGLFGVFGADLLRRDVGQPGGLRPPGQRRDRGRAEGRAGAPLPADRAALCRAASTSPWPSSWR